MALTLETRNNNTSPGSKNASVINYEKLATLIGDPRIDAIRTTSAITPKEEQQKSDSTALVPLDHETFMKEYKSIFLTEGEQREKEWRRKINKFHKTNKRNAEELPPLQPTSNRSDKSSKQVVLVANNSEDMGEVSSSAGATAPVGSNSKASNECLVQNLLIRDKEERDNDHRIEEHTNRIRPAKLNKQGRLVPKLNKKQCARLEKLLTRMPYERPYEDSIRVLNILQNYEPLARQMPIFQLKELVITATVERYDDCGVIVFAGSGFHIVLNGSVKPLNLPYVEYLDEEIMSATPSTIQRRNSSENKFLASNGGFAEKNGLEKQQREPAPTLLAELLNNENSSVSSGVGDNGQKFPTIVETAGTGTSSSFNIESRNSAQKRVSFAPSREETRESDDQLLPLLVQNDQLLNTNKPTSAEKPTTADTTDTFEQMEMIRIATLEGSGSSPIRSRETTAITLGPGECFGTLRSRTGEDPKMMLCRINEPKTLLLKLSVTSFDRISKALTQRQLDKKVNLISTCEAYRYWSRLSLEHLAKCAVWVQFSAGTVLASEGEVCPYAGYLLSGECRMARRIFVKEKLRNGNEINRRKEVIMGTFTPGNSFGEKCLMEGQPMRFTLITVTDCELAVANEESIQELEGGVRQLLAQIDATGPGLKAASFADDEIYQEYIRQEADRRWANFRRHVVSNIINFEGIMPGYGRWSKS